VAAAKGKPVPVGEVVQHAAVVVPLGITLQGYDSIHFGMKLEEVQGILGAPGEETDGVSHPFCRGYSGLSLKGTWRVWKQPAEKQRWIAAKFGYVFGPDPDPPMLLEKMQSGL
jgi:hypothetical protein